VEARLYCRASIFMFVYTRDLGGLGSSNWVVYGHIYCPICLCAPLKYIASGGWPSVTVFVK
jgi:hypothetical protein